MAGTAIVKKGEIQGKGGVVQAWQCSIDPASIAAAAQLIVTIAIPGVRAGDLAWAQPEAIETQLIVQGAKVTASDVVSVYLSNSINSVTAIDGGAKVWNILVLKLAGLDTAA